MVISVHQPQYIPWLGYFDKIVRSGAFVFLDDVQYKAREYQNRNRIRTARGELWLTVPVLSKGLGLRNISEVLVDNASDWPRQHLQSIKTSYGHAEYFDRYFPFFENLYSRRWERLIDINIEVIKHFLGELGIATPLYYGSALGVTSKKTDRIIEICGKLGGDTYLSGSGGKDYLEDGKFAARGIKLLYQEFRHPVYRQQFMKDGGDFMPYLSIVDLVMNEGPRSAEILKGDSAR